MKTILVTGGSGFIGSHLCERLLDLNYRVINLDNFNDFYNHEIKRKNIKNAHNNSNYTLIEGDIRNTQLITQIFDEYDIDTVIHLAALAGVRKSLQSALDYIDIDVSGTVNLLNNCKNRNIKKFIFASSSSVYGANEVPFKEDDNVCATLSPYAAAKLAGEIFCRTYNKLYKIPIVCLRFFTVYGPRQRPEMAIHNFTRQIFEGKEISIFGKGDSFRDYTYINDIIDGITACIDLQCNFEIFNLGNSSPVKLNDLINIIEEKSKHLAYKRYLGSQKGDMEYTYADISKAKELLGYKPKIDIELGIEKFIEWYKNENNIN